MIKSSINPLYHELEDGILEKDYISPFEDEIITHYDTNTPTHLKNDLPHYKGLIHFLQINFPTLLNKKYDQIYAFGGGLPKFESFLNCSKVKIFDGIANIYGQFEEIFRELYNYHGSMEYEKTIINSELLKRVDYDFEKNNLITFIHFLEHQTLQDVKDLMLSLPKDTDVLIYGPNVATAKDTSWIHFRPKDHNILIPLAAQVKMLEEMCYEIIYSISYSDDLLIYFRTK